MEDDHTPLRAGDVVTNTRIFRVITGLRDRSLPKAEWTHHAHLAAGAALIGELGLNAAETAMPSMIRSYNEALGGKNTDSEGYHHTLTLFFLRKINAYLENAPDTPLPERVTQLLASPLAQSDYPLKYYTRELLFSVEARRDWVSPNLQPITD